MRLRSEASFAASCLASFVVVVVSGRAFSDGLELAVVEGRKKGAFCGFLGASCGLLRSYGTFCQLCSLGGVVISSRRVWGMYVCMFLPLFVPGARASATDSSE